MIAVIETGGKQYQVMPGQTIHVDVLPVEVGDEVAINRVLMVADEGKVTLGKPTIEGAQVIARVMSHERTRKVIVFRYRASTRLRVKRGHRQHFTRLKIDRIEV